MQSESGADGVLKLRVESSKFCDCDVCIKAKLKRAPHTFIRDRDTTHFQIVCSDIFGPII